MHHQLCPAKVNMYIYTLDMERFAGLNILGLGPIKVFAEMLSLCLGQACSLFSIIKQRCLYSQKNFHGTLENCENTKV